MEAWARTASAFPAVLASTFDSCGAPGQMLTSPVLGVLGPVADTQSMGAKVGGVHWVVIPSSEAIIGFEGNQGS